MSSATTPRRLGLTLIELLVVIGIMAALVGLLVPAVMKAREAAARMNCASNLRQIALAVHAYHDTEGHLPVNSLKGFQGPFGPQTNAWSWLASILPYVEQGDLFREGKIPENTLYDSRETAARTIKVFLCPSDTAIAKGPRSDAADLGDGGVFFFPPYIAAGQTNYKGVSGANWKWGNRQWHNQGVNGEWDGLTYGDGIFYRSDYLAPKRLEHITDGTSNTFMVGEDIPEKNNWCSWPYANNAVGTCAIPPNVKNKNGGEYSPRDWPNVYSFRSRHPGGLQFAYADGSVHFIHDAISLATYRAMATIRGNESLTAE